MPFGGLYPLPLRLGGSDALEAFTAEQHARMCADLVACVSTAPFAVVSITQTGAGAASVTACNSMIGTGLSYAPTLTPNGTGDVTVAFPYTWTDDYQDDHALLIKMAYASCTVANPHACAVSVVNARAVRVYTYDQLASVAVNTSFALVVS